MTFYRFTQDDIIYTGIQAHPYYRVELNGDQVTGSVYLEREYLDTSLRNRLIFGFSPAEGGFVTGSQPLSSSVDIVDVVQGATNKQLYKSIAALYEHYAILDSGYTINHTGSVTTTLRVVVVPEIYYDKEILTGSFSGSDRDSAGDDRNYYDNGRGGIYSGSLTGSLVGNIFYSEGLIVLKTATDFGSVSPDNFKWATSFKGTHNIPVNIFRCRAPAGELNASTNPTYYRVPTGSDEPYRGEREIVPNPPATYITAVGLYNENYDLVGVAKVAQPIKKDLNQDLLFRIRIDR